MSVLLGVGALTAAAVFFGNSNARGLLDFVCGIGIGALLILGAP